MLVCVDDKHCFKVGKCEFPVAAAERRRRVNVSIQQEFHVADHDFTQFSPVSFLLKYPALLVHSYH